ncbi:MAG: class I SAM-dependent methyltransferase [Candidatus Kariarchaeaceae archaeon]|jgi:O-methyltransferase involved in polyketide biosynthesis
MKKITLNRLKDVSETLLIPLRARYLETISDNGIINDPKSVEIINNIDHDFLENELPWDCQIMISTRTFILDEATKDFLQRNPDGVVVNLGCGLDDRASRVDNSRMLWYDLDLPECIELRKEFFEQTNRFKFISKSVLDFSWIDEITKGRKTFFIAEGLLNYLNEKEVKSIIYAIKDNFPTSEFVFEANSLLITRSWHKHHHIKRAFSMFKWGINTGKILEKWTKQIELVQEWYYLDKYLRRWKWMRFFRLVPRLRKVMKIIHLRFNGECLSPGMM